ncbi:MAG: L-seryl-tRNA(Sec) selenium transferase, partial [Firmicutes bacterium]|nr:L-seryl-tRNA(Sec) selenium transferase [Bacillota bacterium]
MSNLLRQIPAVHKLLSEPRIIDATEGISTAETTALIRGFLDQLREHTLATQEALDYETIVTELVKELEIYQLQRFQEVINATGVLLHTNLGRAPLPPLALERIRELGQGYFNLELNLATGERGSRYTNVAKLFNILNNPQQTTLNDTVIVNNNAAAVLVVLKSLAAGHEVLVSRGQLVEIGGGFRVPEVISASGCILKEVGTTNRTRLSDYERAITPQTKAILLVHPSNYNIIGFTETVEREDL